MRMEETGDGRVMLGGKASLAQVPHMPQDTGDIEYKALAEPRALWSVTNASQPGRRNKVPAAQNQLLFGEL